MNWLKSIFRGIGQVMLQEHALSGVFFLAGIAYNSLLLAAGVLLGTVISTLTAHFLKAKLADIHAGLYGFNGALVGLALLIFLAPTALTFGLVAVAAAFSTLLFIALNRLLHHVNIGAFTAPFVLVAWLFFLATARFGRVEATSSLPQAGLPQSTGVEGIVDAMTVFDGVFNGIGQVFFQQSVLSGLLFVLGLAVNSRLAAIWALVGSLSGVLVAWLMGAQAQAISAGAFGFNSVLVAIALATVFWPKDLSSAALTGFALLITPFAYAALSAFLEPFGLPALTFPFVLITWLWLLAKPVNA